MTSEEQRTRGRICETNPADPVLADVGRGWFRHQRGGRGAPLSTLAIEDYIARQRAQPRFEAALLVAPEMLLLDHPDAALPSHVVDVLCHCVPGNHAADLWE